MKCIINKSFSTHVERTERVLDVAESFGIGLEDKEFVVFKDFEVDIVPGDVVYITGQSGAGKTILLRELAAQLSQLFKVADIDKVKLLDKPLVDQIGVSMDKATYLLSQAGLGEASMFVRKPQQLSDGQRYRLRIAKLLESGAQVWVADEFGAILDRETAKLVAYNIQKQARANNAIVIVATTHTDLKDELGPSVYIKKNYREKIKVEIQPNNNGVFYE